jgi:hypothetical protein
LAHFLGFLEAKPFFWSFEDGFDIFWGAHGLLLASPGLLRVGLGSVLGVFGGPFWLIFSFRRGLRSENFEMLENDDPLNEFVVFSRPQGLQNEIQIDPETRKSEQWGEREPESWEESDFERKSHISSILYAFQGGGPELRGGSQMMVTGWVLGLVNT